MHPKKLFQVNPYSQWLLKITNVIKAVLFSARLCRLLDKGNKSSINIVVVQLLKIIWQKSLGLWTKFNRTRSALYHLIKPKNLKSNLLRSTINC